MKKYLKYADLIILSCLPLLLYWLIELIPMYDKLPKYSIHFILMIILSFVLIKHFYLHKYKRMFSMKKILFYIFIIFITTITSYLMGLVYYQSWSFMALVFYNLTYLPWLYVLVLYGYRRKNDVIAIVASGIILILAEIAVWFIIHPIYNVELQSSLKILYFCIWSLFIVVAMLFINDIFEINYQNKKRTWMYNAMMLTSSMRILVIFIYLFHLF